MIKSVDTTNTSNKSDVDSKTNDMKTPISKDDDMEITILKDDTPKVTDQLELLDPPDTDELITKTEAKQRYLLKDDDLVGLQYQAKQSKTYKKVIMKLFALSEVKAKAYEIWKSRRRT